jgi:hypothetical protein
VGVDDLLPRNELRHADGRRLLLYGAYDGTPLPATAERDDGVAVHLRPDAGRSDGAVGGCAPSSTLVERAIRLLAEPDRRTDLGAAARRHAPRFSSEEQIERTEALCGELLGGWIRQRTTVRSRT